MQLPKVTMSLLAMACLSAAVAIPGPAAGNLAVRHLGSKPAVTSFGKRYNGDDEGADKKKRYNGDDEGADKKKRYNGDDEGADKKKRYNGDDEGADKKKRYNGDDEGADKKL
ncbi:hypothetical protein QBC37DRAFT_328423 [Rhypophila decipiens]|uniref:Uncharacterized protein n=1 Tax=Rhypophila decipiens TaxID=261697 RepID=A0AAN7B0V8_9PEZI|nr:hypothetical protein QBC37DRAFT_328423 [Rhypophila decipiens]